LKTGIEFIVLFKCKHQMLNLKQQAGNSGNKNNNNSLVGNVSSSRQRHLYCVYLKANLRNILAGFIWNSRLNI